MDKTYRYSQPMVCRVAIWLSWIRLPYGARASRSLRYGQLCDKKIGWVVCGVIWDQRNWSSMLDGIL
jgi:hypothetical protein